VKQSRSFPLDVRSVSEARRFAKQVLDGSAPDVVEATELMVSELVTNCIRHVHSGFELAVERTDAQIRVEVKDFGGGAPELQLPGPEDLGGRGLRIVEMLSDSWGVTQNSPEGKTVWFELAVPKAETVTGRPDERVDELRRRSPTVSSRAHPDRPTRRFRRGSSGLSLSSRRCTQATACSASLRRLRHEVGDQQAGVVFVSVCERLAKDRLAGVRGSQAARLLSMEHQMGDADVDVDATALDHSVGE
jgi:anti-sigma regulatory factor (Ser/Thr protein kinase)